MKPLSEQEIRDFIHKLSTESKKVVALFSNPSMGISFTLPGRLTLGLDGTITVHTEELGSRLPISGFTKASVFTTSLASLLTVPCGFSDPREFKGVPPPGFEREVPITFSLGFTFSNGSLLVLMEVGEPAVSV
jgi:hypothetical protein